jgi:hypothetical protein
MMKLRYLQRILEMVVGGSLAALGEEHFKVGVRQFACTVVAICTQGARLVCRSFCSSVGVAIWLLAVVSCSGALVAAGASYIWRRIEPPPNA